MSNTCELCDISFTRRGSLKLHILRRHSEKESQDQESSTQGDRSFSCSFCSSIFESRQNLVVHINSNHSESLVFQKRSAINGKICFFRKDLTTEKGTLADFCSSKKVMTEIYNLIISEFAKKSVFRMSIVITCNYEIPDFSEESSGTSKSSDNDTFSLRSRGLVVNEFEGEKSIKKKIRSLLMGAFSREEDLLTRGSGWRFTCLQCCDILIYDVCYVVKNSSNSTE